MKSKGFLLFAVILIACIVVSNVTACGYGKYQREVPVVLTPPISASDYNVRHMSFIDDSVISGMVEMRDTYQKYKALEGE